MQLSDATCGAWGPGAELKRLAWGSSDLELILSENIVRPH